MQPHGVASGSVFVSELLIPSPKGDKAGSLKHGYPRFFFIRLTEG